MIRRQVNQTRSVLAEEFSDAEASDAVLVPRVGEPEALIRSDGSQEALHRYGLDHVAHVA